MLAWQGFHRVNARADIEGLSDRMTWKWLRPSHDPSLQSPGTRP
jgi:hypothetical protein